VFAEEEADLETMSKLQPNRAIYVDVLRRMTPEQRLAKAFELTSMVRQLARAGVAHRNPGLEAAEVDRLTREHIRQWHSRIS
jgi:hypothetical protein